MKLILRRNIGSLIPALLLAVSLGWLATPLDARQAASDELRIGADDMGGVVEGESGS